MPLSLAVDGGWAAAYVVVEPLTRGPTDSSELVEGSTGMPQPFQLQSQRELSHKSLEESVNLTAHTGHAGQKGISRDAVAIASP